MRATCGLYYVALATAIFIASWQRCAAAENWDGSVAITSDYLLRGVSQSAGNPAAQIEARVHSQSGWQAGVLISTNELNPVDGTTAEVDASVGYAWQMRSDWSTNLRLTHYASPWSKHSGLYEYDEVIINAAYRDIAYVAAAWSPNTSRLFQGVGWSKKQNAAAYDAGLRWPLAASFALTAGVGYYDLSKLIGRGYWYWNTGLSYSRHSLSAEVGYFATDATAKSLFYDNVVNDGWAATLLWHF
jgi:uncharacterized protein (TIGR02001 family)